MTETPLLDVKDLSITLGQRGQGITPVDNVSFSVAPGEVLGIVGESGSGKSLTLRSIIGLLPKASRIGGSIRLFGKAHDPNTMRGHGIAMIFQEPMTALNPTMRVGDLIGEPIRIQQKLPESAVQEKVIDLMRQVGIPDTLRRARAWPHELSGGLRQRVMIAAALATEPSLLLCDEPTTALDVCIQDQILGLLKKLALERGMAMIFVTHDLAVINAICDKVGVMYAGQVIEMAETSQLLNAPQHPYTEALLRSAPSFARLNGRLEGIDGRPPDPRSFPAGCRFAPRCPYAQGDCQTINGKLLARGPDRWTACVHADKITQFSAGIYAQHC